MENKKEKTAPDVSVGADTEQPISKNTISSISENGGNIKSFEELQREMQLQSDPSYLQTISMNELFDTQYRSKQPLIDGLLYPGTYIFAGSPKLGKSFLMAQLAYHVSTGTPLWNYTTRKGTVLYLALEDDYRRLQERLYRMFGTESTDNLYFSVSASQLGNGLDEQLARFVAEHKDTKLIIIDTLQKVREVGGDNYSYANDYQIMARLKSFADAHGLCLLLVHHTRKQNADDKFDMISGTSGLLGAADGAFLLQKEKRTGNAATLEVSGRDQQDQNGKSYSQTYKKTMHNILSAIFNHACRFYNLKSNPARQAGNMGREEKKEMLFWTTEEYKKFSEAVIDKPVSFYAFEMLYWTGMRLGELLALTMEDFDFEKNTVRINKSYQRLQGQDVITTPKTPKSNRTIKLPKFLAEEMQEYFAMLYDQTPTDRIFLVTKSFLHHEMERGCKLSGVKKIRIHDLRHSHISHLIDLGFSAVAIADRVGHESIDITYRYSHLFPSKQVAMADRLDAVNASFEDCEDQDDDVEIMQTEETAPMIDMDAAAEKIISIDKYKAV